MAIPLIDFDVEKAVNECLQISSKKGNNRSKAVFVTVRGSGGGKTRALEEMQRSLLLKDGVLSIAITFNNNWNYETSLERWVETQVKTRILYNTISVIARMTSVIFDIQFGYVSDLFHKELHSLDKSYQINTDELLRYFIRYIIERILPSRDIKTFILLMDEVMLIEKGLDEIFPENPSKDSGSPIRKALLDNNLNVSDTNSTELSNNIKTVNLGLVVSSLDASALKKTNYGRALQAINVPSKLNPTRVLDEILGMKDCKDETLKSILKSLVSIVNKTPRLVEILVDFLKEKNLNPSSDKSFLNSDVIEECFSKIKNEILKRYGQRMTSDRVLSAIVFGDNLKLKDENTLNAIAGSIISNPLESFNIDLDSIKKWSLL